MAGEVLGLYIHPVSAVRLSQGRYEGFSGASMGRPMAGVEKMGCMASEKVTFGGGAALDTTFRRAILRVKSEETPRGFAV